MAIIRCVIYFAVFLFLSDTRGSDIIVNLDSELILPAYCSSYAITGDLLLQNHDVYKPLGNEVGLVFEILIDGPFRYLKISFDRTVDLFGLKITTRVNPTLSMLTYDSQGTLLSSVYIPTGKYNSPSDVLLINRPAIKALLFQGSNAQLTSDEILAANITVCSHNCRAIPKCYGGCRKVWREFGCTECFCLEENMVSKECHGLSDFDTARIYGEMPDCEMFVGYRRLVDHKSNLDGCFSFRYPNCGMYKNVSFIRTRTGCLSHCY